MSKKPTKTEMTTEIASVDRDYRIPIYGGILRHEDDTLMSRGHGKGLKIYDELERDCHCYAVLQKRKYAVVAGEWSLDAASDRPIDIKARDIVEAQLKELPFDRICVGLLDAILKGYAVAEVIWEVRDGQIAVKDVLERDQSRFVFDTRSRPRLLTLNDMITGEELPARKFIVHRFGGKAGNPYGLGLGTRLFWPVFFKRQGITFWLTFADKFGNPTSIGKYPRGSEPADQQKLLNALQAIAHDTGVIIPEGMEIEFLEAKRAGTVNTHEQLARYMDEQISEATLGETLSTNIGQTGSYAAAGTHNEVREELRDADADVLSDTLNNTLITWITELNVPGAVPPKLWRSYEEPEDLNAKIDRDKKIYEMGFEPSDQYITETYGDGWTKQGPAAVAVPPAQETIPGEPPAFAEGDGTLDDIDTLAAELDDAATPSMDAMIDQVRALAEDAVDLQELADRLIELYPTIDVAPLAGAMRAGLALAELKGRDAVNDG